MEPESAVLELPSGRGLAGNGEIAAVRNAHCRLWIRGDLPSAKYQKKGGGGDDFS